MTINRLVFGTIQASCCSLFPYYTHKSPDFFLSIRSDQPYHMVKDDFLSATLVVITTSHRAASPPQALLEHFAWDDMFLKESHPDLIDIAHTDTAHLANRAACLRRLCVRRPTLFACLVYQTVEETPSQ